MSSVSQRRHRSAFDLSITGFLPIVAMTLPLRPWWDRRFIVTRDFDSVSNNLERKQSEGGHLHHILACKGQPLISQTCLVTTNGTSTRLQLCTSIHGLQTEYPSIHDLWIQHSRPGSVEELRYTLAPTMLFWTRLRAQFSIFACLSFRFLCWLVC